MSKYELVLTDVIYENGHKLTRVRRIADGVYGGYIESESNLDQPGRAFLDEKSKAYANSRILDDAQLYGIARDSATIQGEARVFGEAYGMAVVRDRSEVYGQIYENGLVAGQAIVHGQVFGHGQVFDNARVFGRVYGNALIGGDQVVFGDSH